MNKIQKLILEGLLLEKTDLSDEEIEKEDKWINEVRSLLEEKK